MSESSLKIYLPSHKLQNTDVRLKTNSGEKIRPLCKVNVDVSLNQQTTNQNLNVVLENGSNLFDRDCLKCLRRMRLLRNEITFHQGSSTPGPSKLLLGRYIRTRLYLI